MRVHNGVTASEIRGVEWVKSRASAKDGNCVELAELAGGSVAVRDSRFPDGPALVFTRGEMTAFLAGAKNAEFDQLTG